MTNLSELIGKVLDGKYSITKQLGRGGMGAVFLATHRGTDRPVALKVISPEFTANSEFIERFKREAKAAGKLQHPNVVNVTDFGVATVESVQIPYLVMEFLEGFTLTELLSTRRQLPLELAVGFVEQICLAIDRAHRQGIIHRDLKPDNIWLEPNGLGGYNVKVLDFGLAKLSSINQPKHMIAEPDLRSSAQYSLSEKGNSEDATLPVSAFDQYAPTIGASEVTTRGILPENTHYPETILNSPATTDGSHPKETFRHDLTRLGAIMGTPAYMSPEQCRGERVDARSDIYSLGIIVYEMLAGEPPFKGDAYQLLEKHKKESPVLLNKKRRNLPKPVVALVMSALAKNSSDRPENAAIFASTLRARSENTSTMLRQAFALYSQFFPSFLLASLYANIPTIVLAVLSLLVLSGSKPMLRFLDLIGLDITSLIYLFLAALALVSATNSTAIALIVEQILLKPLSPINLRSILAISRRRLDLAANSRGIYLSFIIKVLGLIFTAKGPRRFIPIPYKFFELRWLYLKALVMIIERKRGHLVYRRTKELVSRLPRSLGVIQALAMFLYLITITLSFSSIFGIGTLIGLNKQSSLTISFQLTILAVAITSIWLIPPIYIALAMLYFRARQVGGETLTEPSIESIITQPHKVLGRIPRAVQITASLFIMYALWSIAKIALLGIEMNFEVWRNITTTLILTMLIAGSLFRLKRWGWKLAIFCSSAGLIIALVDVSVWVRAYQEYSEIQNSGLHQVFDWRTGSTITLEELAPDRRLLVFSIIEVVFFISLLVQLLIRKTRNAFITQN